MKEIPHPFIVESLERFRTLPARERDKIHFTHLNHTNPAADPTTGVGYTSLVMVMRFVFHAMWANVTTQINTNATVDEGVNAIATLSGITRAQGSMAAERALSTVHLRLIR